MASLTNDQWIIIAIIFGAGLIIGFMMRSGGAKWRTKYEAEHSAHKALRHDYDAHLARNPDGVPRDRDRLRSGSF